jgi:hypothetical protein
MSDQLTIVPQKTAEHFYNSTFLTQFTLNISHPAHEHEFAELGKVASYPELTTPNRSMDVCQLQPAPLLNSDVLLRLDLVCAPRRMVNFSTFHFRIRSQSAERPPNARPSAIGGAALLVRWPTTTATAAVSICSTAHFCCTPQHPFQTDLIAKQGNLCTPCCAETICRSRSGCHTLCEVAR